MVKVKVISRNPDDYKRQTKLDIHKVPRNYNPILHPFEKQREYIRALNATKLDRVFAKPFIGALDGHKEGLSTLCKQKDKLSVLFSGDYDGELRSWDLRTRKCIWKASAHQGWLRGLACSHDSSKILSCGDDKTVKIWSSVPVTSSTEHSANDVIVKPLDVITTESLYTGIDCHWHEETFVTCGGESVDVWKFNRAQPIKSFHSGVNSINSVRFNATESNLILATTSDRGIIICDQRANVLVNKVVLEMRSNKAVWNPQEAFMFTAANDDSNLYSFDLRNLKCATNVHTDHVDPVIDLDYSPTGLEFVSGSYDKSIRIFPSASNRSREVYHTKRMQRVMAVMWSQDSKFVFSGSDDTNIRIWKANASEKLGTLAPRQRANRAESSKLMSQYQHHPKIRSIAKHRHVPKSIYNGMKEKREMKNAASRKERNRRMNSKPGTVPIVPERKKHIVGQAVRDSSSESDSD